MTPLALELEAVSKRFGATPAVVGMSLSVEQDEIVAVLGPSGSGKTTALRLIAGFEAPDAGRVVVRGGVVADPDRSIWVPPERRRIGMVFQDLALFPHLSVADNVGFGLRGMPGAAQKARIVEVLALAGIADLARRYPHQLSGGQQQRVALARALAVSPDVVLLDEPFAAIDPTLRARLRDDVRRILRTTGASAVLVTHDQAEALVFADRVAVVCAGRVEQCEPPTRLYQAPATRFVAAFVGNAQLVPGRAHADAVETPLGRVPNPGVAEGDEVDVLIRPEDVLSNPDPNGAAVVTDRVFRGGDTLYTLSIAGRAVQSVRPSWETHEIGARVSLRLAPRHYVVFRGDEAIGPRQP